MSLPSQPQENPQGLSQVRSQQGGCQQQLQKGQAKSRGAVRHQRDPTSDTSQVGSPHSLVDMAELLRDNMEAERRRWQTQGGPPQAHFASRVTRREIPDNL